MPAREPAPEPAPLFGAEYPHVELSIAVHVLEGAERPCPARHLEAKCDLPPRLAAELLSRSVKEAVYLPECDEHDVLARRSLDTSPEYEDTRAGRAGVHGHGVF